MFLDVTRRRNPALIQAAVELHRRGEIPPNTYVIDIDTVARNAAAVAQAGAAHGLQLFQMTKQFGRNPAVARAIADRGIDGVVAVDFEEARVLHAHGLHISHLGHLVQIPSYDRELAMGMAPDQVTVYDVGQAEAIASVAHRRGRIQGIVLRVVQKGDTHYPAQRGGIPLEELVQAAKAIEALSGTRILGVTSFPCLLFDYDAGEVRPTQNLQTVQQGGDALVTAGFDVTVRNTPSVSCVATFDVLAEHGSTQAEPGSCLTGHTPLHAVSDQPELPAMVYVSEITHRTHDTVYALGGGLYPRSRARTALVHRHRDGELLEARVELDPPDAIDYHGTLHLDPTAVDVGDTVVYAFRSQVFVAHSYVAPLTGVGDGTPELVGIYHERGWPLDADLRPQPAAGR